MRNRLFLLSAFRFPLSAFSVIPRWNPLREWNLIRVREFFPILDWSRVWSRVWSRRVGWAVLRMVLKGWRSKTRGLAVDGGRPTGSILAS